MSKSTFERAVEPRTTDPEMHTPGPFARHGVMVRDTPDTTGGMFCVCPASETKSVTGRPMTAYGPAIGYAYSRADGDLFAAAPEMLDALRLALSYVPERAMMYSRGTHGERVYIADVMRAAIAKAEGRA